MTFWDFLAILGASFLATMAGGIFYALVGVCKELFGSEIPQKVSIPLWVCALLILSLVGSLMLHLAGPVEKWWGEEVKAQKPVTQEIPRADEEPGVEQPTAEADKCGNYECSGATKPSDHWCYCPFNPRFGHLQGINHDEVERQREELRTRRRE